MKTIECPECKGSRIRMDIWPIASDDDPYECERCEGEGQIEVPTTQEELDELGIPINIDDYDPENL